MLKTIHRMILVGLVLAAGLSACSRHRLIIDTWKDPAYTGNTGKVLVHAMARNPTVRILFENKMVELLNQRGVEAQVSHGLLPDDLVIDRTAMKKVVQENGIGAVFIARPTDRKDRINLRPNMSTYAAGGYASPDDDFYMEVVGLTYMPGTYAAETVSVEIAFFDVNARRRVWSALTDVYVWNAPVEEVRPAAQQIFNALVADKVIR